ncbi:hypothetical protein KDA_74870 [Dictyobacter alpinus]|uniref:Uncharacterized protein n=1 Tax=Dictyobacter alpinus TaxID=2014873 RepID=A0A402BKV5_9CHLR|nr:hypothetical protein [Dictyobacter alpinus]GCE32003.1 hypothetical protein KDA_74870 [Dictyobacter alpinus]
MNHSVFVREYLEHPPPVPAALLSKEVIIDGFYYWSGYTSDGTFLVTVLQSKAWHACECYLDKLIAVSGLKIHNRSTHPAWRETYAAAHDADVWQYFHDGVSVIVKPTHP